MKDILMKQAQPEDVPMLLDLLDAMSGSKKIPGGKQAFDNAVLRGMKEELAAINKELGGTNITMEDIAIAVQDIRSGKVEIPEPEVEAETHNLEELQELNEKIEKIVVDNKKVIKIFSEIKKSIGPELAKDLTDKSLMQEAFTGPKGILKTMLSGLKPDLSLKGLMGKIGLAGQGGGLLKGLGNAYLDKRAARKQFISDAREMGSTKSEKQLAKDWEESNKLRAQQQANEERIKGYQERGWSDEQISQIKDNPFKRRESLATEIAQVDPRFRPNNFDVETGLVKEPKLVSETISSEDQEEAAKVQEEQFETLKQIEINTREADELKKEPEEEPKSVGLLDMIWKGIMGFLPGIGAIISPILGILSSIGSGIAGIATKLGGAAMSAVKSVAPKALGALKAGGRFLGPAAAVAGAGYAGYQAGQWLNENTNIQSNIASGIEKTQDFFGNSQADKEREMFQKEHDAYLKSGKQVHKNTAEMWRKAGVKVDSNVIKPTPISKPEQVVPKQADKVYKESAEQKSADSKPATVVAPTQTIVNAPSTVSKQTQNFLGKTGARTNESSMRAFIRESYS